MREKTFPIVADDDIVLTEMPSMNLYNEEDLISNIMGDYTDRNYLEWEPIADGSKAASSFALNQETSQKRQKTYGELAREQAREDLKKKRSAAYLTSPMPSKSHGFNKRDTAKKHHQVKPTAPFQKEKPGEFAKYGTKLKQKSYILADLPQEKSQSTKEASSKSKNSYDFLKKSQIYNPEIKQTKRGQGHAQELNLTRFEKK
ncbi:cystathionine gamma-synthase [Streptococcus pneumoniae]